MEVAKLMLVFMAIACVFGTYFFHKWRSERGAHEAAKRKAAFYEKNFTDANLALAQWMVLKLEDYATIKMKPVFPKLRFEGGWPVIEVAGRGLEIIFTLTLAPISMDTQDGRTRDDLIWSPEFRSESFGLPYTYEELSSPLKIRSIFRGIELWEGRVRAP